jgi:hypothetical protein
MFYSVDRSGLYQTGGTLDLWQQDPVLGRPFWRLPDWFEADDLRAGAPSGTPRWEILLAPPVRVMERID